MPCYKPTTAYPPINGGKLRFTPGPDTKPHILIPCGGCIGCRAETAAGWAIRCVLESRLWTNNCFITLTYNDVKLPEHGKLQYRDYQLFQKRLRTYFADGKPGLKADPDFPLATGFMRAGRFYMGGEYGEKNGRPHYHSALFGMTFTDQEYHSMSPSGFPVYTSEALTTIWGNGHASVQELNYQTANYIARYVMKKRKGKEAREFYKRIDAETGEEYSLPPEFNRMSLKPGIASAWWDLNREDVFKGWNRYEVVLDGQKRKPPRYFNKKLEKESPADWASIKLLREQFSKAHEDDQTSARLAVREEVERARTKTLKRGKLE